MLQLLGAIGAGVTPPRVESTQRVANADFKSRHTKWKRNFANFKDDEWRPTRSDESVLSNFIECIAGVRKAFPKLSNVVVVVY